jgi:hypothetical protein
VTIEELTRKQESALRRITALAEDTQRKIIEVKREADSALERMANGQVASFYSHGFLGHQTPFDVAQLHTQMEAALNLAKALDCTQESIESAYKAGIK